MPIADSPPVQITYVGGPTTVLEIAGVRFITDPTFDAPGRDYDLGAVTLHKLGAPALQPEQLGKLDVALVSHEQHPDNLDDAGRALLAKIPVVLTAPTSAKKLPRAVGLAPGSSQRIDTKQGVTLTVTATPARHGPVGAEQMAGEVIGFLINVAQTGETLAYVTGDTVWYAGTREVAERYKPRVVLAHYGGARTSRAPFYVTMNTNDVIETAAAFPAAKIFPIHHDGWAHFTQNQQELIAAFTKLGHDAQLQPVEPGKTYTFARQK